MSTPRKRNEYGRAAEADIDTQVDLVNKLGDALDHLKALEKDYTERIERGREAYAEAYQAAIDGGWKAPKLTKYRLPTPKAVASGKYEPAAPSKSKDSPGRPVAEGQRPALSVVPDSPDAGDEN